MISQKADSSHHKPVPTMTEWAMIVFVMFAGVGAIYYLRRQKRARG